MSERGPRERKKSKESKQSEERVARKSARTHARERERGQRVREARGKMGKHSERCVKGRGVGELEAHGRGGRRVSRRPSSVMGSNNTRIQGHNNGLQ
jgi:hypothetical protein